MSITVTKLSPFVKASGNRAQLADFRDFLARKNATAGELMSLSIDPPAVLNKASCFGVIQPGR
jgi:hypothetical protein